MCASTSGEQRATYSGQFSPFTLWIPGNELRPSVLAALAFTHHHLNWLQNFFIYSVLGQGLL